MKQVSQSGGFKRDVKRMKKRGKDLSKLKSIIEFLATDSPLPPRCKDHALVGNWDGWRDCHVEPDWLLIYKSTDDALILGRTGSHSDLF